MNGDGLQDIVWVQDRRVDYWPSLGHGRWGSRLRMGSAPRLPYDYDVERLLLGDVDGDGLADLVYAADGRISIWLNRAGNDWSDEIVVYGTPGIGDVDEVRLADLEATGSVGVLFTHAAAVGRERMFFLDPIGGVKPYLLNEIDNNLGAVTRIEYRSSTTYYLNDERLPSTRWRTRLPFPVHVVARVESIDRVSGSSLESEFAYHHGYWDGEERGIPGVRTRRPS